MIYVASSWRNRYQPDVIHVFGQIGIPCYDFRHPKEGDNGFAWSNIDPDWERWPPRSWFEALKHPLAVAGFKSDMDALRACSACLLVLPCGRSAHLELGWAAGAGKPTAIYCPEPVEPDLMVGMCDGLFTTIGEAVHWSRNVLSCPLLPSSAPPPKTS